MEVLHIIREKENILNIQNEINKQSKKSNIINNLSKFYYLLLLATFIFLSSKILPFLPEVFSDVDNPLMLVPLLFIIPLVHLIFKYTANFFENIFLKSTKNINYDLYSFARTIFDEKFEYQQANNFIKNVEKMNNIRQILHITSDNHKDHNKKGRHDYYDSKNTKNEIMYQQILRSALKISSKDYIMNNINVIKKEINETQDKLMKENLEFELNKIIK
jgi:hypothetical protein